MRLFLIIFFCVCTSSLVGSNYINILYDRSNYRAADKNWGITKDSIGRMYFANDAGLLEFDGIEWQLHQLKDKSVVRSVFADGERIYSGSFEEFGYWERSQSGILVYQSLSNNLSDDTFENDDIWKILKFQDKIYFQSFHSLYVYDGEKVKKLNGPGNVFTMSVAGNALFIQKIDGPLYQIIEEQFVKIPNSDFLAKYKVQAILDRDKHNKIIFTSVGDIFVYDGTKFQLKEVSSRLKNKEINNVQIDKNGNYCIGTLLDGFYIVSKEGNILSHIHTQNQLSNNSVLASFVDENNDLWGGLAEGIILLKYAENLDFFIDYKNNLGSVYTACLYKGKLIVGTNQGLFYTDYSSVYLDDFSLTQFKRITNILGQVWDLTIIGEKLYCAHNSGLSVVDDQLNVSSPFSLNTGVFCMKPLNNEEILLGTYTGFSKVNIQTKELTHFNTLREPIKDIQIDHLGNVWLEHLNRGVYKCRVNMDVDSITNLIYYNSKTDILLPYKLNIFKIGERIAFLGDDKFYIFDDMSNAIKPLDQMNELFEGIKDLKNVINFNGNNFWVLSVNALYNIYTEGNQANFQSKIDVDFKDLSLVYNFETIVPLGDSIDVICLNKGFVLYKKDSKGEDLELRDKPIITLFETTSDKKNYIAKPLDTLEVFYKENSIRISFFEPDLLNRNLSFQYCLEGVDDWSKPSLINQVTYERLPAGKYTFVVRAVDSLGDISETTSIHFVVHKHWTLTWWAFMIYFILFLVFVYIVHHFVLLRYRNIHLLKVRERELARLKNLNNKLQVEMREKDAEILSQTSMIIQKNELMQQVREDLNNYQGKLTNNSFKPLYTKINLLLSTIDSEDDWTNFMFKFEQKHPMFFKYFKVNYPQLTANDLKLCACLKLNLDSKEIASLMNISVRTVENNRSRLRKKLGLKPEQNLSDFVVGI